MNLLTGKIKPIYLKYLAAAFGSAMITSVYSIVDTAMVGQYQGPGGHGGACGCGARMEYNIQPGASYGHRRQRDFQHKARQR